MTNKNMKLSNLAEEGIEVPILRDGNMIYAPSSIYRDTWKGLKKHGYKLGRGTKSLSLRQLSYHESIRVAYWAACNENSNDIKAKRLARRVVKAITDEWIAGDTLYFLTPEKLFIVDFPDKKIVDDYYKTPWYSRESKEDKQQIIKNIVKGLEGRLGRREEKGVVFSDDGNVRCTMAKGLSQDISPEHRGNIAMAGSLEDATLVAELLDKVMDRFKNKYGPEMLSRLADNHCIIRQDGKKNGYYAQPWFVIDGWGREYSAGVPLLDCQHSNEKGCFPDTTHSLVICNGYNSFSEMGYSFGGIEKKQE